MTIQNIDSFLKYFDRIRYRTLRVIKYIPPEKIEWTYQEDKFTLGEMIRHLAAIERYMYAETAQFQPSKYPGCGKELASGYENVVQYLNDMHAESVAIFRELSDEDLQKKTVTPGGVEITLWKWLRAMAEHEIHHRGQIYTYLGMLGIEVPPLYGLTAEEVQKRSQKV
ncbi:MAG: DinB family protein [Bacteroidetes bacterium]|nr:DinB family protein [Bacteroidota bacterium]